uniref:Serpentine receptor class gamma n=1 Tax=Globodera rostochiensis TaxID=31243 RepID=A0A914I2L7_GLORO
MDFVDWSNSEAKTFIYIAICLCTPSVVLYIAEIVTVIRHQKYHNSFNALFVIRAITDLLYLLDMFYSYRLPYILGGVLFPLYSLLPNWMLALATFLGGYTFEANNLATIFILLNRLSAIAIPLKHEKLWQKFLPSITFIVYASPIITRWPAFKMDAQLLILDANSTSFTLSEAGEAPYNMHFLILNAILSVIFMTLCVLINIGTLVAYKRHVKKRALNKENGTDEIERKLLVYSVATFFGHALVSCLFISVLTTTLIHMPKVTTALLAFSPVVLDICTVVLSSWLLLWASGTFRQQLINDFGIMRYSSSISAG